LGFVRPVLFVALPPRVRNPPYAEFGIEPMEMRIRRELGAVLPLDRIADAPAYVLDLVRATPKFRARSKELREAWTFNFGRSVEMGAREIARIADVQAGIGSQGTRLDGGREQGSREWQPADDCSAGEAGSPSSTRVSWFSSVCATSGTTPGKGRPQL